jgi:hypothetical protein
VELWNGGMVEWWNGGIVEWLAFLLRLDKSCGIVEASPRSALQQFLSAPIPTTVQGEGGQQFNNLAI